MGQILRTASNNTININEIRKTCDIDASKTTVWRILDKCPQLTPGHKEKRLR
uniref:Transposase n=1 Tax=Heterorhabditis bacteriophora TaxID=37862 RepID=A0A1I7X3I4_HETBA